MARHSAYRDDPWGRLQRTAEFLAATTFGTSEQATAAVARVQAVHQRVRGVAADGREYSAGDPHLLEWVHLAEVDSFLSSYRAFGASPLTDADADRYVEDMAVVATALGVTDPPVNVAELAARLKTYRPELQSTPEARDAARFLAAPPMELGARAPYAVLLAAAIGLLPWWARLGLLLPPATPVTDRAVVRPLATALVEVLRWALAPQELETEPGRNDLAGGEE
ncbi:MAG: oxygenase MpaB family protein [Ilumatobacteraceae bacterium]